MLSRKAALWAERSRARALILRGEPARAVWILRKVEAVEGVAGSQFPGRTKLYLALARHLLGEDPAAVRESAQQAVGQIARSTSASSPQVRRAVALFPADWGLSAVVDTHGP